MKKTLILLVAILLLFLSPIYSQVEKSYNKVKSEAFVYTDNNTFTNAGYSDGQESHSSVTWAVDWVNVGTLAFKTAVGFKTVKDESGNSYTVLGTYNGGVGSQIWRSTDKGLTFGLIQNTTKDFGLDFIHTGSGRLIFCSGSQSSDALGELKISTDYGATWGTAYSSPCPMPIKGLYLGNSIVLIAGGGNAAGWDGIYRSTDNGLTWTKVLSVELGIYSYVQALGDAGGGRVVSGDYAGNIRTSDDYGLTWSSPLNITSGVIWDICNIGKGRMLASADGGKVFLSDDKGDTWALVADTGASRFRDILYLGGGVALVTSEYPSAVYISRNNGYTWSLVRTFSGVWNPLMTSYGNGTFVLPSADSSAGSTTTLWRSKPW